MGSSASSKRQNTNQVVTINKPQTNILKKAFDSSYFSLKSPFWSNLTHSTFSGGYTPNPLSLQIYKSFRRFLIEAAVQFKKSPTLENSAFTCNLTPPPLVDELWSLAIQFTDHYNSLCQNLIGTFIHRKPQDQVEGFEKLCLKYWPGYDKEFWQHDKKYTVWIFYDRIDEFFKQAYEYVYLRESLRTSQKVYEIHFHLNMIRSLLQSNRNKELAQRIYSEPSESNYFYGLSIQESIEQLYESALSNLTKPIRELIESKLYLGEFLVLYIEEYARFLTMVYLQPNLVTPSHEIQVIWQIHMSLTIQYSEYCKLVFGKNIEFVSIDSNVERKLNVHKGYIMTQQLYIAIFKQIPPALVWPPIEEWAQEKKSKGSWFSLLRVIESIQQVINIYKTKEMNLSIVISAYFNWGKNLKLEKFKNLIENKKLIRQECSENFYKDEGENLKEIDWARMQLPKSSVKVKNTENEDPELDENTRIKGKKIKKMEKNVEEKEDIEEIKVKKVKKIIEKVEKIEEIKGKKGKKTEKKIEGKEKIDFEEEKIEVLEKQVSRKKSPEKIKENKKVEKIKKEPKINEKETSKHVIEPVNKEEKKKISKVNKSIDKIEKSPNKAVKGSNDNSRIEKSPKKSEKIPENLDLEDNPKHKKTVEGRKSPIKELDISHEKKKPNHKTEEPDKNPEHLNKKSKTLKNKKESTPVASHDNSISFENQLKESKTIKTANLLELDD